MKARSFPVYRPQGPDPRGSVIFLLARYLPGLWVRFSRPLRSFSFHGDPARQEIRQSFRQLCEGSRKQAERKQVSTGRPHPACPPASDTACPKGTRGRRAWRPLGGHRAASSLMQERKPRSLVLVKENTTLATGHPMSWEPQARPPPLPPGQTGSSEGPPLSPGAAPSAHPTAEPRGPGGCGLPIFNSLHISLF